MATIVTRAGKGSPLTHNEVDANFSNLNSDKVESSALGTAAYTDSTDYATAAQGALADSAVQPNDSPTFAGLTVDTDTLYVDSTNNRVGIGTSSPSEPLTVDGNLRLEGASYSYVSNSSDAGREILLLRGKSSVADGGAINLYGDGDPTAPNQIVFFTSNSAAGRFDASGNLLVGTATSPSGSGQIVADGGVYLGGTGAANLLGDYEEGTWTPVISDATSGGNIGTATVSYATYTKIGNVVYLKAQLIDINTTGLNGSSNLYVQGLPFVADGTSFGSLNSSFLTASANCIGVNSNIQAGANYVRTTEKISGGSYLVIDVSQFASGTADLWIAITYHT